MANATKYNVELRDKNGNLKQYLTPFVSKLNWEWRRRGGCGRCNITLAMEYRKIKFDADDDIQIRIGSGSTSKLVYRGFISRTIPLMQSGQEVKLEVRGYYDKLIKIIVHDIGSEKVYTGNSVLAIAENIIDTFVVANSDITKGTMDAGAFVPDTISFKSSAKEALRTLADLEGSIEYGVDENLNFFWRTESTDLVRKFFVGDNITKFERRVNWDNLVNKIYFEGGELSNGTIYEKIAEAADSQTMFFLSEKIESNSSITTSSVADQYLGSILKQYSRPQLEMRARIVNTDIRLEDNIPIGKVAIADADYDTELNVWGTTANGGDNLIWGTDANGGSNAIWGGSFSEQIDRIKYELSNTDDRFNIELTFGGTISEASAKIKQIEQILDSVRQR